MSKEASAGNFPIDLRTLAMVAAWGDAAFKAELIADPDAAMQKLCDSFGIPKPNTKWNVVEEAPDTYTIVLPANPLGAAPCATADEAPIRGKTGFVCSYTSECGCGGTYTGGCPCGNTVAGSPCLGCIVSRTICPGG